MKPRDALWLTVILPAALSAFIVMGSAHAYSDGCNECYEMPGGGTVCTLMACGVPDEIRAIDYSLLNEPKSDLQRCYRRCEKNNPPVATPTPRPTVAPSPCEPIGTKTFVVGQDRMFCFTAASGSTFVTVEATSPANVGCAYFQTELTEPSGLKSHGEGAYPMTISKQPRVVGGRYYFWVSPQWISDAPGCGTYKMTVR